jgi:hypothetical protein
MKEKIPFPGEAFFPYLPESGFFDDKREIKFTPS